MTSQGVLGLNKSFRHPFLCGLFLHHEIREFIICASAILRLLHAYAYIETIHLLIQTFSK